MLRIKQDWCEIGELINSPVNQLQNELSTHNLKIVIPNDFPVIKLDFGLIEQALFNLLHNETLYTAANSEIVITADCKINNLIITVSDNGNGFTNEELIHLFDEFYRGRNKNTGGTGLGLSIVRGFVEAHGGQVKAENNIPHGARFTLIIPVEILKMDDYNGLSNE